MTKILLLPILMLGLVGCSASIGTPSTTTTTYQTPAVTSTTYAEPAGSTTTVTHY